VLRSRVFVSLVAGVVTGVLGLTNTLGFLSYFVAMLLVRTAGKTHNRAALRAR
jgi:hypothetical protein